MDALSRLKKGLSGRYTVEQELGRGGMAVVYLGHDVRHDRRVAIKTFERGSDFGAASAERFLREVRVVAKLQHPNIVPVFDSGEVEGLVFYVMPYIKGASLRERLEREGPLPVGDAIRIGREVAEALDHAHRAGVVHRDIKPDNIMLADGVAVVADFGIAHAVEESAAGKLTDTGLALGTPLYMSPEASTGSLVDGRADIYSLGCVLYEMLAGSPPFNGTNTRSVMARHATDAVPPLATVRQLPPTLEATVLTALAKSPSDRWKTARAFADALQRVTETGANTLTPSTASRQRRWIAVGGVAAAAVIAGTMWKLQPQRAAAAPIPEAVQSVSVIPFIVTGDSEWSTLAAGLTDGVTTGLTQVDGLNVRIIPPDTRTASQDPRHIGLANGAAHVVFGRGQVAGNRVRLNVQVVRVADGVVIVGKNVDTYLVVDGQFKDIFLVQDALTAQIVEALQPSLEARPRSTARGIRTTNPQAYKLYSRAAAMGLLAIGDSIDAQVELLTNAVKLDSMYADAWALLAHALDRQGFFKGVAPVEAAPEIRIAINHALQADSLHARALSIQGRVSWYYDWDWGAALRATEKAAKLAPGSAEIVSLHCSVLTFTNQNARALAIAKRTLDSASAQSWSNLANRFLYASQRDSAIIAAEHGVMVDSTALASYEVLMWTYLNLGRTADADRAAAKWRARADSGGQGAISTMSAYYARRGDRKSALLMRDRLLAQARTRHVSPSLLAGAHLDVGDTAAAIASLEQAVRDRDRGLPVFFVSLYWPLKGNPRVEAIKVKVFGDRPVPIDVFIAGFPRSSSNPKAK